ncbi:MAG: deferrochelatase/peroxidase EfeB [Bacillus sp. (in: Bacteria)]|nr:deferrochelatase/peroxidase EfeB [Bacillus sp. (in: firmicutes)]
MLGKEGDGRMVEKKLSEDHKSGVSRREMLKISAIAGAGIAVGASGLASILDVTDKANAKKVQVNDSRIPFYGKHQAGIITPQQTYMYIASFNLDTDEKSEVIALFQQWTKFADLISNGHTFKNSDNHLLPPDDTGEATGLGASRLTVTFGVGPTFFKKGGKDRYGIAHKKPKHLKEIPHMAHDSLDSSYCGGDVVLQVCADDQQVAFHGIRNFIRLATGTASIKWLEEGFIQAPKNETPRNLFGFKDGTANKEHFSKEGYNNVVWAAKDEPEWMQNGSYLGYRKIQMLIEIWDRSSLQDQEDTFGRKKASGAAYGKKHEFDPVNVKKMPADAHVRLAKETGQQIHRRAYSYTLGMDSKTGTVNAGLLFICFTQNPEKQMIPMLKVLGEKDALNEYTKHIGSAMFACPGGLKQGMYFGQTILE